MTEYVKIPFDVYKDFSEAWRRVSNTAEVVENVDNPTPQSPDLKPVYREIWIDSNAGNDSRSGESKEQSVRSWSRVKELLQPGTLVYLMPGYYFSLRLVQAGATKDKPIYFKSVKPGEAVFSNMIAPSGWKSAGQGLYRVDFPAKDYGPWCGEHDGLFLPRYRNRADLQRGFLPVEGTRMPDYGFALDGDELFVRLPNNGNPNGVPPRFTRTFSTTHIELVASPYIIFDGLDLCGHGAGVGINCDEASHSVWIQNCVSSYGRSLCRVSDDTTLMWNQYGYPGFLRFAEDVAKLNNDNMSALFDYVKKYNHDPRNKGNALLEGRMATSIGRRSAKNLKSSNNLARECFDGYSLGEFQNSSSCDDAAAYCFDDAWQLESWRTTHTSKNLTMKRPFIYNCMVGISHQDSARQMEGPHIIERAIIYNPHELIFPPYLIKNMIEDRGQGKVRVEYDHCFFHNPVGVNSWGKNVNFLYLDHKKGKHIDLVITNSIIWVDKIDDWAKDWNPHCDYNVLVSPEDYPHIRGKNGVWFQSIEKLLLRNSEEFDFRPLDNSPIIAVGKNGETPGPYEAGSDSIGIRSLDQQFTGVVPSMWSKNFGEHG